MSEILYLTLATGPTATDIAGALTGLAGQRVAGCDPPVVISRVGTWYPVPTAHGFDLVVAVTVQPVAAAAPAPPADPAPVATPAQQELAGLMKTLGFQPDTAVAFLRQWTHPDGTPCERLRDLSVAQQDLARKALQAKLAARGGTRI